MGDRGGSRRGVVGSGWADCAGKTKDTGRTSERANSRGAGFGRMTGKPEVIPAHPTEARPLQKSGGRAAAAPRNSREGSKTKSRAMREPKSAPWNRTLRHPAVMIGDFQRRGNFPSVPRHAYAGLGRSGSCDECEPSTYPAILIASMSEPPQTTTHLGIADLTKRFNAAGIAAIAQHINPLPQRSVHFEIVSTERPD